MRLIAAAYGRLEEQLYLLPADGAVGDALRLAEDNRRRRPERLTHDRRSSPGACLNPPR